MNRSTLRSVKIFAGVSASLAILLALVCFNGCSNNPPLESWHTEKLSEEFTADLAGQEVSNFEEYLELESRLFKQLDDKVYANTTTGPDQLLNRYSAGSAADPRGQHPDWNRSFELEGKGAGGVLLLHGMSDSPYSLRALGESLNRRGYHVIGLRMPGHGTAPSGLKYISWQDMAAAVDLAMERLASKPGQEPGSIHIIGYSTGASLALDYTLKALAGHRSAPPASLVLISPAIRVHSSARFAGSKNSLAAVPGLERLAWLSVMDEFDPYKYNSFATNAGAQVHRVTIDVDRRMQDLARDSGTTSKFPPVLVFKSAVDSTVTTDAVVDNLLYRLPADRNELVLFDINRHAAFKSTLLVEDPAPLTNRLLAEHDLPFAVRFLTNENPNSSAVVAKYKAAHEAEPTETDSLEMSWPRGVISLSHVALPFAPDDPLYGQFQPSDQTHIYLGDLAISGERGLLKIPGDWLLRMRYNPFYDYLQQRVFDWFEAPGVSNP
jgi:alpha-beta hydrolase superfamily lysophospholipase